MQFSSHLYLSSTSSLKGFRKNDVWEDKSPAAQRSNAPFTCPASIHPLSCCRSLSGEPHRSVPTRTDQATFTGKIKMVQFNRKESGLCSTRRPVCCRIPSRKGETRSVLSARSITPRPRGQGATSLLLLRTAHCI
ncbi:hypothetical protein J6590_033985 [Homalodisca vitripennis]|nr:hypothetical protein J6590_033985 [Homalodisca vitripennis]